MMSSTLWIGYRTILRKEVTRIFRIWPQTILPSVMTQFLYFLIFGSLIGSQISGFGQGGYAAFLVPGLIMMSAITNAFSNTASSFFGAKFSRSIEELLVSPLKSWTILAGYVSGGVVRSLLVAVAVFLVSLLFAPLHISHLFVLLFFLFMTCLIFSLLGFLNGLFAQKFDDVSIIPTFVLTPLTYLGGVFYSLDRLPAVWRVISYGNPIVYMIDGFRYGFSGVSSTSVVLSGSLLVGVAILLLSVCLYLMKKGMGLKT